MLECSGGRPEQPIAFVILYCKSMPTRDPRMPDYFRRAEHLWYRLRGIAEIGDGENAEEVVEEASPSGFDTEEGSSPDKESAQNKVPSSSISVVRAASVPTSTPSVVAVAVRPTV